MRTRTARRTYFIDKSFQSKFILKFCSLVAIGGALTIAIVYLLARHSNTVAFVNSRVVVKTTADFILPLLVQTVVIVLVLISLATLGVALFVSHKIAGPLYRFKKVIQQLKEGNFCCDFKIRHLDQLQDLAQDLNDMILKVRGELRLLKTQVASLDDKLDGLSEQETSEAKKKDLNELKHIAKEINKIIGYFKT